MQFSVIIPAKNEQATIGRCLDSLRALDWEAGRFEIIVVDNGSSDATASIARAKGAAVYVQPELTIAGLRNFGAGKAQGELLAFIDADCTVSAGWLARASRYLPRHEVVCFGSPPGVPENASWVQLAWFLVRRKPEPVGETDWLESMNLFVRREAFLSLGGFDQALTTCEDYDLSLRIKRVGRTINDSSILATHHGEAATVREFFRKELWRGQGNLAGLLRHGVVPSEIPSLVAPGVHCLLLLGVTGSIAFSLKACSAWLISLLALWQCALLVKSVQKQWPAPSVKRVLQLLWLLNIYLLARGLAVFTGKTA